jgi:hypothetical protein
MRQSKGRVMNMEEALLVEVKSGKLLTLPWNRVLINNEGYLFAPDKNGEPIWVQLVNWQWMPHEEKLPEA